MLISGPRDGRGYVHSMEQTSVKRERGQRADEVGYSYYLGNVFDGPGEVRPPWNGTPLLLLSTLTTEYISILYIHPVWFRCK